jgi:hypothetical protein
VSFEKEWSYGEVWWKGGYTADEAQWREIWPASAETFDRWVLPMLQGWTDQRET